MSWSRQLVCNVEGDAYRYTIQPIFHDVSHDARCHIRRHRLDVLYELFFFVQLPPRSANNHVDPPAGDTHDEPLFQTPKVYRTVWSGGTTGDPGYRSRGRYSADYLTVEHNAGLDLPDEVILRRHTDWSAGANASRRPKHGGPAGAAGSRRRVQPDVFTVQQLNQNNDNDNDVIAVHEISRNIFVASTQFERPFDYSTSTWTTVDQCSKNATKIKPAPRHNVTRGQPVEAIVQAVAEPFLYFLKSVENPPYIRFTVPGNMSILPFYFPGSSSSSSPMLRPDSLVVSLHLATSLKYWLIRISGDMSECPAYLAVTITDLVLYDELFRYDLLILCPPTFNVSFRFPNTLMRSTQDLMTSSFDVHLSDAVRTYHVYLTHVDLRRLSYDNVDSDDVRSEAIVFHRRVSASTSSGWDHSFLFPVIAVIIIVLAVLLAFIHADRHTRPARWVVLTSAGTINECRQSPSRTDCTYHLCGNGHVGRLSTLEQNAASPFLNIKYRCYCRSADGRSFRVVSTSRYRLLVCAYATLWLVTGLLATFNVFFYVVSVLVDSDWRYIAAMSGEGQADMARVRRTVDNNFSLVIDRYRRDELLRYRDAVVNRLHACRSHVDNTIHHTSATLATESAEVTDIGWLTAAMATEQYASRLAAYGARVNAFKTAFQSKLTTAVGRAMRRYGAYVNSLINNVWLRFAVHVFNSTHQMSSTSNYYALGNVTTSGFGTFLDVDEVRQVEVWVSRFWQRYERWLPQLPDVPLAVNSSASNPWKRLFNVTDLHHLDSSRFIVSSSDATDHWAQFGPNVRRTLRSPRTQRRQKTSKSNIKFQASPLTSPDTVVINFDRFQLIFVAVDVAIVAFHLCRGYIDLQRLQRYRCRCHGVDQRSLNNGGLMTTVDPVEDRAGLSRLLPPPLPSVGVVPTVCTDAAMATTTSTTASDYPALHDAESDVATCSQQRSTDDPQRKRRQSYVVARTAMTIVGRILRSRSLLPLLACAFVLATTNCIIRSCSRLTAPHLTVSTSTLASVFASTVRFHTAAANAHLREDTRHLDTEVFQLSSSSMTQDLRNLLGIVNYFRQEQSRLTGSYASEACDVRPLQQLKTTSCDDANDSGVRNSALHIPVIVPCSFVPVSPRFLDERLEQQFEQQLVGSIQSFIDATRRLVTTATYVILLGIAASFSLRVAAVLVLRRLAFTSARRQRCQAGFDGELEDQSTRVDNGVIDDVTDDDDDDVSCQCDVTEYHGGATAPPPISTRQSETLRSLKYYETNV